MFKYCVNDVCCSNVDFNIFHVISCPLIKCKNKLSSLIKKYIEKLSNSLNIFKIFFL